MTDPTNNPPANTPPGSTPPAAPPVSDTPPQYEAPVQPAYPGSAPPPPAGYGAAPTSERPGRTLGIVAFVLSFFTFLIATVLGIIALVQSRRAGQKNGFALAAIIISVVLTIVSTIALIAFISFVFNASTELYDQYVQECLNAGGSGFVESFGQQVPCDQIEVNQP